MNRYVLVTIACGVVPMATVHFAYWLNIQGGALDPEFICNPYLEGCVSTSRAVRTGPGLVWFKAAMMPLVVILLLAWRSVGDWMAGLSSEMPNIRRWTLRLGIAGAIALVFYVIFLGTDGPVYTFMRRYGIYLFFGCTALAQLVAAGFVWGVYPAGSPRVTASFIALVSTQWAIGVFSVLKRVFFEDPEVIDRVENITEWFMIATMSLGFVLLGLLLRNRESEPRG